MSLQSKILRHLEATPGAWAVKVEVANERGCPDILCCVRGRFLAIEVKKGTDRLSKIQEAQGVRINEADGYFWVITDFEKFRSLLFNMLIGFEMKDRMNGT